MTLDTNTNSIVMGAVLSENAVDSRRDVHGVSLRLFVQRVSHAIFASDCGLLAFSGPPVVLEV